MFLESGAMTSPTKPNSGQTSIGTPETADTSWETSPNSDSTGIYKNEDEMPSEGSAVIVAPSPPLSSAVDVTNDPSTAVPVRKGGFKPHPKTAAEKLAAKEKAVNRLNRIKAKAIQSANESLGIDESNLSAAIGMTREEYESSKGKKKTMKKAKKQELQDPQEIQYLADTLGIPVELFGVKSTNIKNKKIKPKPGGPPNNNTEQAGGNESTPSPSNIQQDTQVSSKPASCHQANSISHITREPFETTEESLGFTPQPGSLAAALGMHVDHSSNAPPVRCAKENAGDKTGLTNDSELGSNPKVGSLASALGIRIDESIIVPPVRSTSSDQSNQNLKSNFIKVRPGSLAAALGVPIDPSLKETSFHQQIEPTKNTEHHSEISSKPQPGSLADALGMAVDFSNHAPPIVQLPQQTSSGAGNVAVTLNSKNSPNASSIASKSAARPGSLADALGIVVDTSAQAPPVRFAERTIIGNETCSQSRTAQPGSLANALGMSVDTAPNAIAIRTSGTLSDKPHECWIDKPKRGSLADALGMKIKVSGITSPNRQSQKEGEASKISIDRKNKYPKELGVIHPIHLITRSDTKDSETDDSESLSETSEEDSIENKAWGIQTSPKPGSLAAALGMTVDTSTNAAPIRQDKMLKRNPKMLGPIRKKKTLFDAVYSNVKQTIASSRSDNFIAERKDAPSQGLPRSRNSFAALGMPTSSLVASSEPVKRTNEYSSKNRKVSNSSPGVIIETNRTMMNIATSDDSPSLLRAELATVKAELAGAKAYSKALEERMLLMSQDYAAKMASLQQQIASYEIQVASKSDSMKHLEGIISEDFKIKQAMREQLDESLTKISDLHALMIKSDSILKEEFDCMIRLKGLLDEDEGRPNSDCSARTSHTSKHIQSTLQREGNRQQSLKARLQAMRDANGIANNL